LPLVTFDALNWIFRTYLNAFYSSVCLKKSRVNIFGKNHVIFRYAPAMGTSSIPQLAFRPNLTQTLQLEVIALDAQHRIFADRPHRHHFHLLMCLKKAQGWHQIDGQTHSAHNHQALFLLPQQIYDARGLKNIQGWMVVYQPEALWVTTDSLTRTLELLWYSQNIMLHDLGKDFAVWETQVKALQTELLALETGYQEAAIAHLRLLLVDVLRRQNISPNTLTQKALLERVFVFIDENHQSPISLRDVAKAVNRSSGYLTELVHQQTGETVLGWIQKRRFAEARRLLLESNQSIERIALQIGYRHVNLFIVQFRRAFGITPHAWRLKQR
jgi:AraC-like DNA-binding protein